VVALVAFAAQSSSEANQNAYERTDITVLACTALNGAKPSVTVSWQVDNTSDGPRDYSPTFIVRSAAGDRLGSGSDTRNAVPPGGMVYQTSVTLDTPYGGPITCALDE